MGYRIIKNNVIVLTPFFGWFWLAGLVPCGTHLAQSSDRVGERGGTPCCSVSAEAHLGESRREKILLVNCMEEDKGHLQTLLNSHLVKQAPEGIGLSVSRPTNLCRNCHTIKPGISL